MRTAAIFGLLALLPGSVLAVACSAANDPPADPSGSGAGSGIGGGGTGGEGAGIGFGGFGGGDPSGAGCSSDLQKVVDEDGGIIQICPPDQGCSQGQCIPACQAAANSKGSIGCAYYAPATPFYWNEQASSSYDGACHAVFVANTWGRPAKLSVQRDGQALDATAFGYIPSGIGPSTTYTPLPPDGVPPGEVAVLFLSHRPGVMTVFNTTLECPRPPALLLDTAVQSSGRGSAVEVLSDTPITAYDILPYGGASSYLPSAAHLFPSSTWGDNYYVVGPHPTQSGQLWMTLVGSANGTTVDLVPASSLPGGPDVPAATAGSPVQLTINAGEMVQWLGGDPSGTVIQASQPIGVWTGNNYLQVSTQTSPGGGGQDSAHQQIAPISALGSEYVGAGVVTRISGGQPESVPYRLLGVVDGTTLTWDPAPPPGAPASLGAGQVVEFETTGLFSVRAQDENHPFALTHYLGGAIGSLGDEEWVIQLPPRQFLQRYVFFTDPTYGTTTLVVTRVRGANGFSDVTLSCLGLVQGWQPIGSGGQFEVAHVTLTQSFIGAVPACETSRHEATSDGAFGITVWGTDYYASYGYPAGGNVGVINTVVVPPVPE